MGDTGYAVLDLNSARFYEEKRGGGMQVYLLAFLNSALD
jgi:hypothetical protein